MLRGRRNNQNTNTAVVEQEEQNNFNSRQRQVKQQPLLSPVRSMPNESPVTKPMKSILKTASTLNQEPEPDTKPESNPNSEAEDERDAESEPEQEPESVEEEIEKEPEKVDIDIDAKENNETTDEPEVTVPKSEIPEKAVENGNGPRKPFFKKVFGGIRKKPSVRARERKIRQNRHLRKIIIPKNALMALYEIKGIQIGDFIINTNPEGGFTALVTVNNNQYEGSGISKSSAKANACEKAFRDYVVRKMTEKPRSMGVSTGPDTMMDASSETSSVNGEESMLSATEADDVPMVNLASFALFKLFSSWESDGCHIPEFHGSVAPAPSVLSLVEPSSLANKGAGRNELPSNWEVMHPASLLCIMRPRLTYTDCGNNGDHTKPMQTVKVIVDDQEFVGTGRSKKIARKNVAIAVCNNLFGTNFRSNE